MRSCHTQRIVAKTIAMVGSKTYGNGGLMETKETILKAYPYLEAEDIDEALRYATLTK